MLQMRELIAFTDGGSRGNPGDAAAGVHYPNGLEPEAQPNCAQQYTMWEGKYIGVRTNNEAEYEALIIALNSALKHSHSKLKVFSDSKLMVNQMKGIWRVEAPTIIPLWETAYTLACQLDFEIEYIPRAQNKEADRVCNEILGKHQGKTN